MTFLRWIRKQGHRTDEVGMFCHYVYAINKSGVVRPPKKKEASISDWIVFLNDNSTHIELTGGFLLGYVEWMDIYDGSEYEHWRTCAREWMANFHKLSKLLEEFKQSNEGSIDIEIAFYIKDAENIINQYMSMYNTLNIEIIRRENP